MTDTPEALPPMCEPPRFFELLHELAETGHISGLGITSEAMARVRAALAQRQQVPEIPSSKLLASIVCSTTKGLDMLDAERIYAAVRRELSALTAAPSAQEKS